MHLTETSWVWTHVAHNMDQWWSRKINGFRNSHRFALLYDRPQAWEHPARCRYVHTAAQRWEKWQRRLRNKSLLFLCMFQGSESLIPVYVSGDWVAHTGVCFRGVSHSYRCILQGSESLITVCASGESHSYQCMFQGSESLIRVYSSGEWVTHNGVRFRGKSLIPVYVSGEWVTHNGVCFRGKSLIPVYVSGEWVTHNGVFFRGVSHS